jgi:hypothetical protein
MTNPKKITRLSETDLARVAFLSADEKRHSLRRVRDFIPTHSWAPFRSVVKGIFQTQKSLFDLPKVKLEDVLEAIRSQCRRKPNSLQSNLELAKLAFEQISACETVAIERYFGHLSIGYGSSIKFWEDLYTIEGDSPVAVFIDPRRSNGLNAAARKFIFSGMHHQIAHGDFANAKFKIYRFPVADKKTGDRTMRIFEPGEGDIVEYDEFTSAIDETYQIWFEILAEREAAKSPPARKTGTDGSGQGDFGL